MAKKKKKPDYPENIRIIKQAPYRYPSEKWGRCYRKVPYATAEDAWNGIKHLDFAKNENLAIYRCSFCSRWHVGHFCPSKHVQINLLGVCLDCKKHVKESYFYNLEHGQQEVA